MKKLLTLVLLIGASLLFAAACTPAQPPEPTAVPTVVPTAVPTAMPTEEAMEDMPEEDMEHDMENMSDGDMEDMEDMSDGDMQDMDDDGDMDGMEHGAEMHEEDHGGQVGMAMAANVDGTDFHLELVSDSPGQFVVYLSDNNREPVSVEGYEGTLAVINPDGSEIISLPLMGMGDHLMAVGGPEDVSQLDVRINVDGPDLVEALEMEFTIIYPE